MILQQNREALERQDALKRKLLAICDSESVYAKNLMEYFSQSEDMGYRVRVFSDAGQLFQYGKQHTIDLLLMGDQYPEEMRGKIPAKQRILLTRVEESAESRLEKVSASGSVTGKKEAEKRSEGVSGKRSEVSEKLPTSERWVYKYQAASKILQEILVMIREPQKQKNERKLTQTQAEGLIGVYSPVHRIGKTGFALKLGEQLGEEQPVLYLNSGRICGCRSLSSHEGGWKSKRSSVLCQTGRCVVRTSDREAGGAKRKPGLYLSHAGDARLTAGKS